MTTEAVKNVLTLVSVSDPINSSSSCVALSALKTSQIKQQQQTCHQ